MREKIKRFIAGMFYRNRVPSSLIFYGKEGIGKKDIGFELSMSLLCLEDKYPPCNKCQSCRHMKDFLQKKPEELRFYGEDKKGKRVYLYLQGDHPDFIYLAPEKAEIKIDQIRGVKDFAYLSPALSKRKVVFIEPADAMNPYAQNALLKVLEEPPPDTHFILVSQRIEKILPTIKSRSFLLEVPPLTQEELKAITQIEDPLILELSEGSIKMANQLKEKKHIIQTAKDILQGNTYTLYKKSLEIENWVLEEQVLLLKVLQAIIHKSYLESKNYQNRKALDTISLGLEYLSKGVRLSLLLFQLKGGDKHVLHKGEVFGPKQNTSG
ncbi:MAG: DNA polymerase III subunit [Aquificaceae bacterium]